MKQFLLAQCADKPTADLLNECLKQLGDIPPEATFGFIYLSDLLIDETDYILNQLKEKTGLNHWVGSLGIGLIATQQEYYDQTAMVIMIADFNEADFCMLPNFTDNTEPLTENIINWCNNNDFNVGLIHGDPENPAVQPLIHQLGEDIPGAFLLGGISSSRRQAIQIADKPLHNGISGVLF